MEEKFVVELFRENSTLFSVVLKNNNPGAVDIELLIESCSPLSSLLDRFKITLGIESLFPILT